MSSGSLDGVRVVVTRATQQAANLISLFQAEGARVEPLPLLEIGSPADPRALERALSELPLYDWIVFTSANSVEALLGSVAGHLPSRSRVAALGEATSRALARLGIEPDLVGAEPRAEGLVTTLGPHVARRRRVLLPQAEDARNTLEKGLSAAGADVVRVDAYRKVIPQATLERANQIFADGPWGWVTFTSPSTVQNLARLLQTQWEAGRESLLAASIGPITSTELRKCGLEPTAQASTPSDEDLLKSVLEAAAERN